MAQSVLKLSHHENADDNDNNNDDNNDDDTHPGCIIVHIGRYSVADKSNNNNNNNNNNTNNNNVFSSYAPDGTIQKE